MKIPFKVFEKIVRPCINQVLISCYNIYRAKCIENKVDYLTFTDFSKFVNDDLKATK